LCKFPRATQTYAGGEQAGAVEKVRGPQVERYLIFAEESAAVAPNAYLSRVAFAFAKGEAEFIIL